MSNSEVYRYPHYYAIAYQWNTEQECDFIQACLKAYGPMQAKRLLDIGCGAGRHLKVLAQRGYQMTGLDLSPEMVAYVQEEAQDAKLNVQALIGDLRSLDLAGPFDAAFCFMDTFRFLLTNEDMISHLKAMANALVPGGLYLTDFWIPRQWDQIGNDVHQWEQARDKTTVRVFYLQHPESVDPIAQTFEDELIFEVHEEEKVKEIRGGRTRTRLVMPQEFRLLAQQSGVFDILSTHGEFDLNKRLDPSSLSWRMISVLKKR